jgi:OOP family OmpA-OmpF porin
MKTIDFASASGRVCLLAVALLVSPLATADGPIDWSHWYIGVNAGVSQATIDDAAIEAALLANGFTTNSIVDDDGDIGWKLYGGYRFNKYLALEGGLFDLGGFGFDATTTPAGTLNGAAEFSGYNIDLVGYLPFGDTNTWSAFGRIGYGSTEANSSFSSTGAVTVLQPSANERSNDFKYGAGIQMDFNPSWGARLEFERYAVADAIGNEGDIDLLSLGLVYRFGQQRDNEPAPVAAADPVPAPLFVVVPVPAMTERYCTILDINFEINQDEMQRADVEKLGTIAIFMRDYPQTTAVVQGHSDDVGSADENLKLSQRRADAAVGYLVDNEKIARSRLSAVGYGESRPIADNATSEGKQANRRLNTVIACATDLAGLKPLPARVTMALEIQFDPYESKILPESRDELRKLADFLKKYPDTTASVEGHSGNYIGTGADKLTSTPQVSMDVSVKRAQHVVDYLAKEFGVSRSRLSAEGFGHTRRVAYGTTLEGQQENRRINVIINYPDQASQMSSSPGSK